MTDGQLITVELTVHEVRALRRSAAFLCAVLDDYRRDDTPRAVDTAAVKLELALMLVGAEP